MFSWFVCCFLSDSQWTVEHLQNTHYIFSQSQNPICFLTNKKTTLYFLVSNVVGLCKTQPQIMTGVHRGQSETLTQLFEWHLTDLAMCKILNKNPQQCLLHLCPPLLFSVDISHSVVPLQALSD